MNSQLLSVGNKLEMTIKKDSKKGLAEDDKVYVSQILDMKDELIVAAMPISEGHVIPLTVGSVLETFCYTTHGIYKTDCEITARGKEGNLFLMQLLLKDELKKFQRRQYYRLPCLIQADVRKLEYLEVLEWSKEHTPIETFTNDLVTGMIVDISGGGVRIMTSESFKDSEYVYMKFPLDMNIGVKEVELMGKVITSIKSENRADLFDSRIQFKELKNEIRDTLIKYIYEQQRKVQKRERS